MVHYVTFTICRQLWVVLHFNLWKKLGMWCQMLNQSLEPSFSGLCQLVLWLHQRALAAAAYILMPRCRTKDVMEKGGSSMGAWGTSTPYSAGYSPMVVGGERREKRGRGRKGAEKRRCSFFLKKVGDFFNYRINIPAFQIILFLSI